MRLKSRREIERLRGLMLTILAGVSIRSPAKEEFFKYTERRGRTLFFLDSAGPAYLRAKQLLLAKARAAGRHPSETDVENHLVDFVVDLAYQDPIRVKRELDGQISDLFKELKLLPVERYLFLVPVEHIAATVPLDIGGSVLIALSGASFHEIEAQYNRKLDLLGETPEGRVKKLVERNETENFIKVRVEASDWQRAAELAIQKADGYLNVIRLYVGECPCLVRGEALKVVGRELVGVNLSTGSMGEHLERTNLVVNPLVVDQDFCDQLQKAGLPLVDAILRKEPEDLTDLEGRLLEAIFWHGNATKDPAPTDQVVKLVSALDSLFIMGERNKKEVIARRFVAVAYRDTDDDRKADLFDEMVRLIDIRNRILHGGLNYVEADERKQLEYWTRSVVQILLRTANQTSLAGLLRSQFPEDRILTVRSRLLEALWSRLRRKG